MTNEERDMLLQELKLKLDNLAEDVDQIKHVLIEGNGKPPLTEQVLTSRLKIERLEEERSDGKMPKAFWVGLIVSSLISVGSIIVSVA